MTRSQSRAARISHRQQAEPQPHLFTRSRRLPALLVGDRGRPAARLDSRQYVARRVRELHRLLASLDHGELEKVVLTQRTCAPC
jgi:hypothetical protein